MAKEHLQASGQPPETGAGARPSRASARGRESARARGATAILGGEGGSGERRLFSAPAEKVWQQWMESELN